MEAANLRRRKPVRALPGIKPGMPQRLIGIDIAKAGDLTLIHEDDFYRPAGLPADARKVLRSKFPRICVDSKRADPGRILSPREPLQPSQMAAVNVAERALARFQHNVHVQVPRECILGAIKPEELAA
jgi:hypothetical protein